MRNRNRIDKLKMFFILSLALFIVSLAGVLSISSQAWPADLSIGYSAAFVPPHNEPVVDNKVARYRAEVSPVLSQGWLKLSPTLTFWGVNTWTPRETHLTTSWRHDDWSIEEIRPSMNLQVDFGPKKLRLFSEYYAPLGNWSHKGAGSLSSYWWLIGVRGELKIF